MSTVTKSATNYQKISTKSSPKFCTNTKAAEFSGPWCATQRRQPRVSEAARRRPAAVTGSVTAALHRRTRVTAAAAVPLPRPAAGIATGNLSESMSGAVAGAIRRLAALDGLD